MKTVSFKEYEDAKFEIIRGVEWHEENTNPNQYGMNSRTYSTEENGNFYEVTDPHTGITEFWSDKHSESRYYDRRTREEVIAQYEEIIAGLKKEITQLAVAKTTYQKGMNENADMIAALTKTNIELKEKLAAIKAMTEAA